MTCAEGIVAETSQVDAPLITWTRYELGRAAGLGAGAQARDTEPSPATAFRSMTVPGQLAGTGVLAGVLAGVVGVGELVEAGAAVGEAEADGATTTCSTWVAVDDDGCTDPEGVTVSVGVTVSIEAAVEVAVEVVIGVDVELGVGVPVGVGVGVGVAVGAVLGAEADGATDSTQGGGIVKVASAPWAAVAAQGAVTATRHTPSGMAMPA